MGVKLRGDGEAAVGRGKSKRLGDTSSVGGLEEPQQRVGGGVVRNEAGAGSKVLTWSGP